MISVTFPPPLSSSSIPPTSLPSERMPHSAANRTGQRRRADDGDLARGGFLQRVSLVRRHAISPFSPPLKKSQKKNRAIKSGSPPAATTTSTATLKSAGSSKTMVIQTTPSEILVLVSRQERRLFHFLRTHPTPGRRARLISKCVF